MVPRGSRANRERRKRFFKTRDVNQEWHNAEEYTWNDWLSSCSYLYFGMDSLRRGGETETTEEYRQATGGNRILGKETQWPVDILSFAESFVETINRAFFATQEKRKRRKRKREKEQRRRRRRWPTRRHRGRKRGLYTYKALWHAKEVGRVLICMRFGTTMVSALHESWLDASCGGAHRERRDPPRSTMHALSAS